MIAHDRTRLTVTLALFSALIRFRIPLFPEERPQKLPAGGFGGPVLLPSGAPVQGGIGG